MFRVCHDCEGSGRALYDCGSCRATGEGFSDRQACYNCGGKGEFFDDCDQCNGTGLIETIEQERDQA